MTRLVQAIKNLGYIREGQMPQIKDATKRKAYERQQKEMIERRKDTLKRAEERYKEAKGQPDEEWWADFVKDIKIRMKKDGLIK